MRIHLTEHGPEGEDGEHYTYETDLDVANEEEAYVKGREWARITCALVRGLLDHHLDHESRSPVPEDEIDHGPDS